MLHPEVPPLPIAASGCSEMKRKRPAELRTSKRPKAPFRTPEVAQRGGDNQQPRSSVSSLPTHLLWVPETRGGAGEVGLSVHPDKLRLLSLGLVP